MEELYSYMKVKIAEMYECGGSTVAIDVYHAFRIYHLICRMKQIKGIINQDDDMLKTLQRMNEKQVNT